MEIEQQPESSVENNPNNNMSVPYLLFTFGFGTSLLACLIYAGVRGLPFVNVVLIGGAIQVMYRVSKRAWLNALNPDKNTSKHSGTLAAGIIETIPTIQSFAILYLVMIAVSAIWYGIGSFFAWVF